MRSTALGLLAAGMWLAAASTASAQYWGTGSQPRDGACFFKDSDYRGEYFCLGSNDQLDRLPRGVANEISSIRIFGRAEVMIFKSDRFRGEGERLDSNVRNLRGYGWNDTIESIMVRRDRGGFGNGNGGGWGGGGGGGWNGGGRPGYQGNPDAIVRRAYQDILQREPDPQGARLYRSRIIDDGWSEQQVREALRNSPEFREAQRMTPDKARDIVRQAYLNVLRREPDAGANGYVNKVLRERWTREQVERELMKSPEYRQRPRG